VVFQLHSYHQQQTPPDTTGFSRWYFNFTATTSSNPSGHHRASAGGISTSQLPPAANPSGHHRASAGGPSISWLPPSRKLPLEELFAYAKHPNHQGLASCEIKVPPAEAWWCS